MPGQIGEAFVLVKPVIADFRQQVAQGVERSIGNLGVQVPIDPKLAGGASGITWQKLAGGTVIPVPITPTITPEARRAFAGEVGGLRGFLLGGGQFAASRAIGISTLAGSIFLFAKGAISAVKAAASLEQELNVFQQASGATADQMERVRKEARQLGADISLPGVSAADAAATMTELAKAGLTVDQVFTATRGTLLLASAAHIDFASAAAISANALTAFELPGTQAVKIADLLAGAANAAQGDIASFGVALDDAAVIAHQAGLSIQDTTVFLTLLSKAGLRGADAGTSLRTALLHLIAPTAQAKQVFQALGVEITDARGNVRTDVFDQLGRSLDRLKVSTRNQALELLFGARGVRAAAVLTRASAADFDNLATQVEKSGQAQQTAQAQTSGLAGAFTELRKNLGDLSDTVGAFALGPLTSLTKGLAGLVSDADEAAKRLGAFAKTVSHLDLGPFGSVGDVVKKGVKDALSAPFAPLHAALDTVRGDFKGAALDLATVVPGLKEGIDALTGGSKGGAVKPIDTSGAFAGIFDPFKNLLPQTKPKVAKAGKDLGKEYTAAVAHGISAVDVAQQAVDAARKVAADVTAEGQKAVQAAIKAGRLAVENAAFEAKQNLAQIGDNLAQQVGQLIDTGPLGQRIARLQGQLDALQQATERGRLRRSLRDAQDELARAERSIEFAPGRRPTAEQQAGLDRFLKPFKEKVKDAQAALGEFNTEGLISKLQKQADAQKKIATQGIADLIARFNAGQLTLVAVNATTAGILQKAVGPFRTAGKNQGFAFRQAFVAELEALRKQAAAIIVGPQTRRAGVEPTVVSPAQVAAQARQDVADAQKAATDRVVAANTDVRKAVEALNKAEAKAAKEANSLLGQIAAQLKGGPAKKPSSAVVQTTSDRTGTPPFKVGAR